MESKTELNRAHFDNEAADYDAKHEKAAAEIARRIEARRDFIGVDWVEDDDSSSSSSSSEDDDGQSQTDARPQRRAVRLLDYACGTGAMSRILAPYTTQCVGIDLSENMVAAYNTRARNQALSEDEMCAFHGNICLPEDPDPAAFRDARFANFDVACVGLGFHHFDDPQLAATRLVARLRPAGGVLVIIDFLSHEREREGEASKTVTHHGFAPDRIADIFVKAGAGGDFALQSLGEVTLGAKHGKRVLFMARGTRT